MRDGVIARPDTRRGRLGAAAFIIMAGCTNLSETDSGVATLQVLSPAQPILEVGDTTRLIARALDNSGDDVSASIQWRAPDSTLTVDSNSARITRSFCRTSSAKVSGGTGSKLSGGTGSRSSPFFKSKEKSAFVCPTLPCVTARSIARLS